MRVLVSGASGLIGSAFLREAQRHGDVTVRLARRGAPAAPGDVSWDITGGMLDPGRLEGFDAVVNLAGENIAGRWTGAKKARIRGSRVGGTSLLAQALARVGKPPRVLVCASAVGFYGDTGEREVDESAPAGTGFLAETCKEWEGATGPARAKGIRVVSLRFGVVLSPAGGALARMLLPFRVGLGGRMGTGRQYMPWIALDDAAAAIRFALDRQNLTGPVNAVTPHQVTNAEFTKTLGRVLRRPTIFPMPGFAARLVFGEMADALLLASARVRPARLIEAGFRFHHPDLEPALRHLLSRPA